MTTHLLIPARLNSTRLPHKPLLPIHGIPMLVWTANKARRAVEEGVACDFWVACDDQQIADVCTKHHIPFVMTSPAHVSGTDRLAQAATLLGFGDDDMVINLQGDEPLVPPLLLSQLKQLLLDHPCCAMATLCEPIDDDEQWRSPSVVKVVFAKQKALYFSRAAIPHCRDEPATSGYRHLGLYAYRTKLLHQFSSWPVGHLERLEQLEQLRVLENGQQIAIAIANAHLPAGVDTAEDLARLNALSQQQILSYG